MSIHNRVHFQFLIYDSHCSVRNSKRIWYNVQTVEKTHWMFCVITPLQKGVSWNHFFNNKNKNEIFLTTQNMRNFLGGSPHPVKIFPYSQIWYTYCSIFFQESYKEEVLSDRIFDINFFINALCNLVQKHFLRQKFLKRGNIIWVKSGGVII